MKKPEQELYRHLNALRTIPSGKALIAWLQESYEKSIEKVISGPTNELPELRAEAKTLHEILSEINKASDKMQKFEEVNNPGNTAPAPHTANTF